MFRGNFKESDARIVKIDKADSKHFEKMLNFMYTDYIEKLEYDQLLEMLALANKASFGNSMPYGSYTNICIFSTALTI